MKKLFCAFLSIVLLSLSANHLYAQNWTKEQMEVWNVVVNNNELMYKGDFDGYFANVHEDYQGWNNQIPLPLNKTLYKQMMPSDERVESIKLDYIMTNPARIVASGDVAVVHYVYAWSVTITTDKGSDPITQSGKNTEFFVKEDGKWLLIGDMTVIDGDNDD
jgi:hypothetical protein